MQCCVPFCTNTADNLSRGAQKSANKTISFHGFPRETPLRDAWLQALGKQVHHLPDSAVVCSQHFLRDDIHETESGLRQIVAGATPSTVQVCMLCLDTDSELFLLSKYNLEEEYEKLTGHPPCDLGNLKQTVCMQCVEKVINFSKFRDQSLRTYELIMDLVMKYEFITLQHIKMIDTTMIQPVTYATIKIEHCDDDNQTELEETVDRVDEVVAVKTEECHEESVYNGWSVNDNIEIIKEEVCTSATSSFDSSHISDNKQDIRMLNECSQSTRDLSHLPLVPKSERFDETANDSKEVLGIGIDIDVANKQSSDSKIDINITNDKLKHPTKASVPIQGEALPETRVAANFSGTTSHFSGGRNIATAAEHPEDQTADVPTAVSTSGRKPNISSVAQSEVKYFNCKFCQFKSKYKGNLKIHLKTHTVTGDKLQSCKLCDYKTAVQSRLAYHMLTHTGEKLYTCKSCDYKTAVKSSLVSHIRTHTGEKPYSCKLCDYRAAEKSTLVKHVRTHTGEKPYSCKLCDYKSGRKGTLMLHIKTHTGEKSHFCKLCDYKTAVKSSLVKHMRTHTGEKPYSCKLCDYKAALKSNLVKHVRSHTGEKPFSCKSCDYKTAVKSNLVCHMRTHTGEKPYFCKMCDYKTALKSSLVYHMRTHTGEKPYACKSCDYRTAVKSSLVCHMRTHTGEKPYFCKLCDYKTAQNSCLVKHMKTHC